jgi:hypothetical protein
MIKSSRGKDQIPWSDGVWKALDHAVFEEMTRTRVGAKFLPLVHATKKQATVEADVVIVPPTAAAAANAGSAFDPALSVDESQSNSIQEYWTEFRLSMAQVQAEAGDGQGAMGGPSQGRHSRFSGVKSGQHARPG